ncbi:MULTISPECIES: 3-dehydroquinate synthase [Burkholderiaceae]|uniref:3-dehydroquinate synthase n=1 Tax=Burkholderiaceae TaxID=119060 RepID=UPI000964A635|nr:MULTISPECIES: 3-dehydroquinate synthase [Burkholderiaceae]SIT65458.1 3-dehydroquinate synthase [Burkholderia sp. b14]
MQCLSESMKEDGPIDENSSVHAVDTDSVMQRFNVPFEYPVYFTRGVFSDPHNLTLQRAICRLEPHRRHRFVAVVDAGLANANPAIVQALQAYALRHADTLKLVDAPRVLAGGEQLKHEPDAVRALQQWLHDQHIDRHACVVTVGGGAVLDAVGYAAATTHRGVRLIRLPTTVLAQNDAGIGVKTAINAFGVKNFLGTFTPPFAVINDFDFIATLPARHCIAGMAEAVKVAAIRDRTFFDWLTAHASALANFEPNAMQWMIRRCAELHLQHISQGGDPFESGSARPLDFGHWAAHKLETLSAHTLMHGEAVAIGLALDTRYAVAIGLLEKPVLAAMYTLLSHLGFRLWHDALDARDQSGRRQVLEGLTEFREHLGGELTVTLIKQIGQSVEVHTIDECEANAAIDWLQEQDRHRLHIERKEVYHEMV